jgi:hypothetical protein
LNSKFDWIRLHNDNRRFTRTTRQSIGKFLEHHPIYGSQSRSIRRNRQVPSHRRSGKHDNNIGVHVVGVQGNLDRRGVVGESVTQICPEPPQLMFTRAPSMTDELEPRISFYRRTIEQLSHELTSARSCCADDGHTSRPFHR